MIASVVSPIALGPSAADTPGPNLHIIKGAGPALSSYARNAMRGARARLKTELWPAGITAARVREDHE
ncbi:hypothetical protein XI05_23475 [Bradyrhizobium sp. CCBAU 11357]|nr:hypothetical protein [Bradyrhizobium sp. CCBAU 11357]